MNRVWASLSNPETRDKNRPIASADKIAYLRALSALDPETGNANPDYMAKHFISTRMRWLLSVHGIQERYIKSRMPGTYYYHIVRTKHFDHLLQDAVREGAEQLVLLGAGNDTRPYRFSGPLQDVTIFELDYPGTQEVKKSRLKRLYGRLPEHVTFIPIDFESETLKEVLFEAGFDSEKRTFFIWEGVTYYLHEEIVRQVLGFIARYSGKKSSVAFDYILSWYITLDGCPDTQELCRRQEKNSEPFLFGIDEGKTKQFLQSCGLSLVSDTGAADLENLYLLKTEDKHMRVMPCFRIAFARR